MIMHHMVMLKLLSIMYEFLLLIFFGEKERDLLLHKVD